MKMFDIDIVLIYFDDIIIFYWNVFFVVFRLKMVRSIR